MRIGFLLLTITLLATGITGCSETKDARPAPVLDFTHGSPILLDVRVAEIDFRYHPQIAATEHRALGDADAAGGADQMGAAAAALGRHRERRPLHHH